MLIALVYLSVIFANFLALIIVLRNPRSPLHRYLSLFLVFGSLWVLIVNMQNPDFGETVNLWIVRSTFIAASLMTWMMLLFALSYTKRKLAPTIHTSLTVLALAITVLCVTPLVIPEVTLDTINVTPHRTTLYVGVVGAIALFAFLAVAQLSRYLLQVQSQLERQRTIYIILGLILGTVLGIATNIFLPNIAGNIEPARYSFAAILLWSILLSYAILRHRFLDIRLIVARSLTYILLFGTLAVGYIIAIITVAQFWFNTRDLGVEEQVFYVALAIFAALTIQPLKRFFDRLTSRIFYKNDYDLQKTLDDLSRGLVKTLRVRTIIKDASESLQGVLRTDRFLVNIHGGEANFTVVTFGREDDKKKIVEVINQHAKSLGRVTVVDEILDENTALGEELSKHGIGVIAKMAVSGGVVGYIILGRRRSGELFTTKDVQLLSIASEQLAVAIQNALRFEEIQNFNETLQEKVDDATQKLRRTNQRLRELDAVKDEFMSIASHQLRTPLTSIKGYISMVLDGDAGALKKEQRRLLTEAYASSQRMVYLIGDFLNVSRIHTGKFALQPKTADLAALVSQEVEQLSSTAKNREITLRYDPPEQFPLLKFDEDKMHQVVMNFIDNAIFYTPSGGTVTVTLMLTSRNVQFKVVDTGVGVPEKERHKLFTKFFRASNASKMRPDGTGIGLFMSKKVILLHGGTIIFESKEGKGSTFGFTIPLKNLLPDDAVDSPADQKGKKQKNAAE